VQLRCTNCDASFEGERDARCPKCLRRTSVVVLGETPLVAGISAAEDAPTREGGVRAASWPAGTSCPLCLERDVSDRPEAIFFFQLARQISKGARWLHVRCRCCDECRSSVEAQSRQRKIAAPFIALGIVAAGLSLFSDGPFVKMGIPFPTSIAVGLAIAIVLAGIPLFVIDHGNRTLRKRLEASWLFRKVKGSFVAADGFMAEDQWRVLPDVPEREKSEALNAEDLAKS